MAKKHVETATETETAPSNGEAPAFDFKSFLGSILTDEGRSALADQKIEYDGVNGKADFVVTEMPIISVLSLCQRGLAHLSSNVVSSGVISKVRSELGGKDVTTAQITAWKAANGDKIKEWTAAEFGEAMEAVRTGILDTRKAGRRSTDPVESLAWEFARVAAEQEYLAYQAADPSYVYRKAHAEEGAEELMGHDETAEHFRAKAREHIAAASTQRPGAVSILSRLRKPESGAPAGK